MKKTVVMLLVLLFAVSFAFSGASSEAPTTEKKTFTVGICNFVDDASLNQICENIQNQLASIAEKRGVEIKIKYDNCNADANVMSQIIVATPVAMQMQAATEDNKIPVVFAAVSDPLSTGIVASLDAPGANITGTSDFLDTNAVMNLVFALNPQVKKVGLLYDAGQDASTTAIKTAKDYLKGKGVTIVERMGTTVDEVVLAANALIADKVDAVFTPSDNTIMTAELSIYEAFAAAKIPHYAGADSFALNGAFLGYGVDYANLGRVTGDMVAEILLDGGKPATMPVRTFDNGTATVNIETAAAMGYNFDTLAATFGPFCTKVVSIKTAESF